MTLTTVLADTGKILIQFAWDLLYFPLWWYTRGLFAVVLWVGHFLHRRMLSTGLLVWLKNLFTPMFGQHDIAGKLISFFVRLIQIGVRSVIMSFWLVYAFCALLLWIFAPLYILYELARQLGFFI